MIHVNNVTKHFGKYAALKGVSCKIDSGSVYGLVGSNGAGKSTLLRLMNGVYRADSGEITIDGTPVFNSPAVKKDMVFIADELYFLPQSNMRRMAALYAASYPSFSFQRFAELCELFRLNPTANLNTFSKGMRRQAAVILALSSQVKYLFMDETFDGLDPVMRELVKRTIYSEMERRNATAVIASHSLRELEDTCDQLALLHEGGLVLESDMSSLKTSLFKVQIAFSEEYGKEKFNGISMKSFSKQGSVSVMIVNGDRGEVEAKLNAMSPLLLEVLPLSLEEVFVHEMEAFGYVFDEALLRGGEEQHG